MVATSQKIAAGFSTADLIPIKRALDILNLSLSAGALFGG
jgi:hypothetical protein